MALEIEIVEVESPQQMKSFIMFPFKLYKGTPNWVPPLISERKEFFNKKKNPFYRGAKTKYFLALKDGKTVGRIATCVNYYHNQFHQDKIGFFGFFESIDDFEVAAKLFKVAMITLKAEGMEKMRGPMNFSTNQEIGFLIEGFDKPPTVMNPYNMPYLPKLAERFGLKKVMDLNAYLISGDLPISERQLKVVNKIKERNHIRLRSVDMSRFDEEVKLINNIYNQAWSHNWGFVPMPEDEFVHMAKGLKQIVEPELALIAYVNDEPAGFSLAVPDINQVFIGMKGRLFPTGIFKLLWNTKVRRKIKGVRMLTMGVIPKFQKRGIDSIFYVDTYQKGLAKGYQWAELSWILETNELMCKSAGNMGGVMHKKYRIVEMPI
ncbi:MAG: N-acetyltransferase [candidate division Zixibacteria bacterium]|nr:N-acetyltransferase [candidate division Zixibacteria bacterium]